MHYLFTCILTGKWIILFSIVERTNTAVSAVEGIFIYTKLRFLCLLKVQSENVCFETTHRLHKWFSEIFFRSLSVIRIDLNWLYRVAVILCILRLSCSTFCVWDGCAFSIIRWTQTSFGHSIRMTCQLCRKQHHSILRKCISRVTHVANVHLNGNVCFNQFKIERHSVKTNAWNAQSKWHLWSSAIWITTFKY